MGPLLLLGAGAEDTHGAAVPVLLSGSKLGLHFPAGQVPDRRIPQPPVPVSTTRVTPGLILCTLHSWPASFTLQFVPHTDSAWPH